MQPLISKINDEVNRYWPLYLIAASVVGLVIFCFALIFQAEPSKPEPPKPDIEISMSDYSHIETMCKLHPSLRPTFSYFFADCRIVKSEYEFLQKMHGEFELRSIADRLLEGQ